MKELTEQEAKELSIELEQDRIREERNEQSEARRSEGRRCWIKDNIRWLRDEYLCEYADEFDNFCADMFEEYGED